MASLCCGLNFLPSVVNSPSDVLHASFAEFGNVCNNFSLSLPSNFSIIGTFSLSFNPYDLVWIIFVTSIWKLSSSIYLSRAFQLKDGYWQPVIQPCVCVPFLHWSYLCLMWALHLPLSVPFTATVSGWITAPNTSSGLILILLFQLVFSCNILQIFFSDDACIFETFLPDII